MRRGLKRLEPATKASNVCVFASLSLHARSCYATFSCEDRTRYSKGQFYTHPQPDKILWFQRIRPADGFAEHRTEGISSLATGATTGARRFGRQSRRVPVTIWRALQTHSESSWINELCPALPFTRSPALWTGVCQLPPTRRLANFRVARDSYLAGSTLPAGLLGRGP